MDEMSFSVAYALRARGIALMFLTATERRHLPVDLSDEILIEKPFKAPPADQDRQTDGAGGYGMTVGTAEATSRRPS